MTPEKFKYIADNIAHAYKESHDALQDVDGLAADIEEYAAEYDNGWRLSSDELNYISPSGRVVRKI